ncbi:MAG: outer membrane cobalamin receptor [Gammaproteobacteria bacterium]|jgi:outer membrane cobalamin receptor
MICTSPYNIVLAAIISAGTLAHAQSWSDTEQQTRDETLETLETVGQISYQTGDVLDGEETLNSVSISQEQLSRTPAALAEVISRETGIQYKQSGGFGSYATVSIRAASAAQTGVYLDGVLLNSGGNPAIDLSTLEILNLGSVDVYRGGTPSRLGHGGIGGAVNLNTLRPDKDSPATRIRLEYGSLSLAGLQATHQVSLGKWDLLAAASRRQSDNDFTFLNDNRTPLNPNDDERQVRENAHALRSSALLRAGYQHSVDSRTDITVQLAARELGVPEWRNQSNNQSGYDTKTSQLQLSHVIDGIGGWNSRQGVYRHDDENHFMDPLGQVGLGIQDTLNQMQTEGAKTYWEYPTDSGTLGLSVEYRKEILNSNERLGTSPDYDAEQKKWLATAQYTWYDTTESLTISPSISWQHNNFRGARSVGATLAEGQNNGSRLGAQLGLGFQASNTISFSANIGSYYRPPSFGELYGSIGLVNGNSELIPEEGINADLGILFKGGALELTGSVFAGLRDEIIVTVFDSRRVGRPVNTGEAEVLGLELGANWTISPELSLRSNLTWQSPKSLNRTSGLPKNFLPGEAQFVWFGRAEYAPGNWTAWYEVNVQNRRYYDLSNILPAADTTQHSAGFGWSKNDWGFSLSANNLSNENVEDFNGFPKPRRTFSLLTTYSF